MSVSIGAGTDIFVRKVQPGASVGVGYWIDVFQNGVKIDSFRVETKKKVVEIVKRYKEKYHTDRAFLNESQTHITYKTKEERGETAMQSLDQELHKKANTINIALQKLLTPLLPVKIREAEALGQEIINPQGINIIPETPGNEPAMSEDQIGPMLAGKFIEFVNKNQPQQGQEWVKSDDLYNPLKKWLTAIKKKIEDYERMNTVQLDMNKISDIAEGIVFSGDPGKIKESTKIEVTPEVSAKVKEVASMKAGIRKKQSQDNERIIKISLEKASDIDSELEKAMEEVSKEGPEEEAEEIDEFGGSKDTSEIDILKKETLKESSERDIRNQILSFLSFSKNTKEAMELGRAVSNWSNKLGVSIGIAKQVFNEISNNMDIYKKAFDTENLPGEDYFSITSNYGILKKEYLVKIMSSIVSSIANKNILTDNEIDAIVEKAFGTVGSGVEIVNILKNSIKASMELYMNNWMKKNRDIDPGIAKSGIMGFAENAFNEGKARRYLYSSLSGEENTIAKIRNSLLIFADKYPIILRYTNNIINSITSHIKNYAMQAYGDGSWVKDYIRDDSTVAKNLQIAFDKALKIETPSQESESSVSGSEPSQQKEKENTIPL